MPDSEIRTVKPVRCGCLITLCRRGEIQLREFPGAGGVAEDTVAFERTRED